MSFSFSTATRPPRLTVIMSDAMETLRQAIGAFAILRQEILDRRRTTGYSFGTCAVALLSPNHARLVERSAVKCVPF